MRSSAGWIFVWSLTTSLLPGQDDARAIIRKSVQADNRNQEIRRNYTYKVFDVERDLDAAGNVKATHTTLTEVLYIGSRPHMHILEKDGKPLPPDEARKAQARLDKAVKEADRMTEEERKAQAEKARLKRARDREELQYIPDAFDFQLVAETDIGGRPAWQIKASPHRNYKGRYASLMRNMEGMIWIDKQDYQWVKVEAEALDTISFGWFLARIGKGTRLSFENMRVNDEIWAPKRLTFRASARLGLVKKLNAEQETTFSDYKKFRTDSRIVDTEDQH